MYTSTLILKEPERPSILSDSGYRWKEKPLFWLNERKISLCSRKSCSSVKWHGQNWTWVTRWSGMSRIFLLLTDCYFFDMGEKLCIWCKYVLENIESFYHQAKNRTISTYPHISKLCCEGWLGKRTLLSNFGTRAMY